MAMPRALLRRLRRDDRGASLVEFAVVLPMMLLVFAVIVEGGRMTWNYQSAAAGVRDAVRYLSRIAPADVCTAGTLSTYTSGLLGIVRDTSSGTSLFPASRQVTVDSVNAQCVAITGGPAGASVVKVTATVTMQVPMARVFTLFGGAAIGPITTTIADQSRVFGT